MVPRNTYIWYLVVKMDAGFMILQNFKCFCFAAILTAHLTLKKLPAYTECKIYYLLPLKKVKKKTVFYK